MQFPVPLQSYSQNINLVTVPEVRGTTAQPSLLSLKIKIIRTRLWEVSINGTGSGILWIGELNRVLKQGPLTGRSHLTLNQVTKNSSCFMSACSVPDIRLCSLYVLPQHTHFPNEETESLQDCKFHQGHTAVQPQTDTQRVWVLILTHSTALPALSLHLLIGKARTRHPD